MRERTGGATVTAGGALGRAVRIGLVVLVVTGCSGSAVAPSTGGSAAVSAPGPTPMPSRTAAPPSPTPTPVGPRTDPSTWPLAWSDEFDGAAGDAPDEAAWLYDVGGTGWGNEERQFYTSERANAALDGDGNLLLTARTSDGSLACHYGPCDYTSARIKTKGRHEFLYGRLEARIKVPAGFGLWPAFWMLGTDIDQVPWPKSGEIDVMEFVGRRPTEIDGTIHGPGYFGSGGVTRAVDLGTPVSDDFHVFAIEWVPGRITWFLDGVQYHEVRAADVVPNAWVFDRPFFILLNLAVGGNRGGPVFPDTRFPASMAVDYVRVYQEAQP